MKNLFYKNKLFQNPILFLAGIVLLRTITYIHTGEIVLSNAIASMSGKVLVIGSSNTDMVVKTDRFPQPGETVLGGTFFMNAGGKGANQAVAAKRLGADVTFVTKVGADVFGAAAVAGFQKDGINTDFIFQDETNPSGVALITIDAAGQNNIVVAPGANMQLHVADVERIESLFSAHDVVLLQLEIPLPTVAACVALAKKHGKPVILNPAPAMPLDTAILQNVFLFTPNESEAELVTGLSITSDSDVQRAAQHIRALGVQHVIITLGSKGAYLLSEGVEEWMDTLVVQAIDTTAAGDVFNGALAAALSNNYALRDAVRFANKAAAISVTRLGAQASVPYAHEVV